MSSPSLRPRPPVALEPEPRARPKRSTRALAALALLVANALVAPVCAAASARATTAPLPVPPRLELPKPGEADLEHLDALLVRLTSEELEERVTIARELEGVKPRQLAAIAQRLAELAERGDREPMKRLLTELQESALKRQRAAQKARGSDPELPDSLTLVLQDRPPLKTEDGKTAAYSGLVQVLALSRTLRHLGSVEATRVLIDVYVQFGEFLRLPVQRELLSLGDRSVPALIEARQHPMEKVASFARRQLDALGRAVPSEAVQIQDPNTLADVLRAYGRTKDPDARRILTSFAASDRALIREAAREAIVLLGEVGIWQVRESYEEITGKRPPRDWSWEHLTRELFAELDRMRSATVMKIYEEGQVARARGDLSGMRRAFDLVLARDPSFERPEELAKGYLEYATGVVESAPADAEDALARALRLTRDRAQKRALESLLLTVQAGREIEQGVVDRSVLVRALALDPENARAKLLLEDLTDEGARGVGDRARKLALGTLLLGALAAAVVLLRKRPWKQTIVLAPRPSEVPSSSDAPKGSSDEPGA